MIVDIELIFPEWLIQHISGVAYVDVQPAIGIDVHENNARAPFATVYNPCFLRDVLKLKAALVEAEFIAALVGSHENLGQAVIIKVSCCHPASIVEIPVTEDIGFFGL
jgi:hypothetical protein